MFSRPTRVMLCLAVIGGCLAALDASGQLLKDTKAPETFSADAAAVGQSGSVATVLRIQIDRYTSDEERDTLVGALKTGGHTALLAALHQAPAAGSIAIKDEKWTLRWARQQKTPNGRVIVVATDQPVYFVGGGRPQARSREGFDVAVVQLDVDEIGFGKGSMAPAARIKAGEPTGIQIEDYAGQPIPLVSVKKVIS